MQKLRQFFFKYLVYYPAVLVRGEWIWQPLRLLNQSQRLPNQAMEELQLKKVNAILSKASTSKYYHSHKLPSRIKSLIDIQNIRFLTKEDLRTFSSDLQTEEKPLFFTTKTSGGSTGAPVTIKKPANAMAQELAAAWRGYSWANIQIGDLQARFWGVPMTKSLALRARAIDFVAHRIRFSAFQFSKNDLATYTRRLERAHADYFYGYVSMVRELANYLAEFHPGHTIKPKSIITTSEVLNEEDRKKIQDVFQCKVYNEYGCGEVGTIAHECEKGSMHINMENILVEIVNEKGEVLPDDQEGEIVVTDLNNSFMPIIRYRICDYGSLSSKPCSCGRTLKVLNSVKGRAYDFIENESGEKFHGEFFLYIVEEAKSIGIKVDGVQFVLESGQLKINLVAKNPFFDQARSYIESKLKERFSRKIPITFNRTEEIPREPSGKLRVIKRVD